MNYYPSNTAVLRGLWEINWDSSSWLFIPASDQLTPNLPSSLSYLNAPFAATEENYSSFIGVLGALTNIFGTELFPGEKSLLMDILCGYPVYIEGFVNPKPDSAENPATTAINNLKNTVLRTLDLNGWNAELEEIKPYQITAKSVTLQKQ